MSTHLAQELLDHVTIPLTNHSTIIIPPSRSSGIAARKQAKCFHSLVLSFYTAMTATMTSTVLSTNTD